MKKILLTFAVIAGLTPAASFAQEAQLEKGAMDVQELEGMYTEYATPVKRSSNGDVVAGVIIGAIIGAVAAEAFDNDTDRNYRGGRHDRNDRRGDRWGRGGRGHGGRGHGGGWNRQALCYAQNARGQVFRAVGNRAQQAQRQAVNKCLQHSRACRPMGCQVAR